MDPSMRSRGGFSAGPQSVSWCFPTLPFGSIRSPQIPILSTPIMDHPDEGEQKPLPLSAPQNLLTHTLQGTILQDKSPLSRHRKVREVWDNSGYSFFAVPGSERSPGEGNGYPLLYSCLENSVDRPWGRKELDTIAWLTLYFGGRVSSSG